MSDPTELLAAVRKLGSTAKMFSPRDAAQLSKLLESGEQPLAVVGGVFRAAMGFLTATDRRLIFSSAGALSGPRAEIFPYRHVSSIEYARAGLLGRSKIVVHSAGNKVEIEVFDKDAGPFVQAVKAVLTSD